MADNWFAANAPTAPSTPSQTDWFASNAPGKILTQPPKGPNTLPEDLPEGMGRFALRALPAIGGTIGAILAPEGVIPAMAAAGLGGGFGSAAEQGIQKVVGSPEAPRSMSEFGKNVGTEALMNAGGEGAGRIINGVIGKTVGRYFNPERLYQSALKPPPSMGGKSIQKIVKAGINEGVPVNETGAELATQKIDELGNKVSSIISSKPKSITPEVVNPIVQPHSQPLKPLHEMSPDELDATILKLKNDDKNVLVDVFGPEGAKKYSTLQRTANSSFADPARSNAAFDEMQSMEGALSEAQRNRLFGIGEPDSYGLEDAQAVRRALGRLDFSSPNDLADSLKWAISRFDPAKPNANLEALAQLRYGTEIAQQNGWDTAAITKRALQGAASRFKDPEDAAFVLSKLKNKPKATAAPGPLPPPPSPKTLFDAGLIDPRNATTGLQDLRNQFTQGSGDPSYLKAINSVEKNFLKRHPSPMTAPDAQATKQALYKEVRLANQNAYKPGGAPVGLDTQAKQEIADGLKGELEQMFPEIRNLNQREGALIELRKALDRFTNREGNKQLIPYFSTVAALGSAGAGALTGHATAGVEGGAALIGAQLVKSMLEDPAIKSKLAIALTKAGNTAAGRVIKKTAPYVPGTAIRIGADEIRGAMAPHVNIPASLPPPPK